MEYQVDSKQALRILIVTHSPLSKEFGAGQMAINLADAFLEKGHDVQLWSPYPLPKSSINIFPLYENIRTVQKKIDQFLIEQQSFDLIDCPPVYITNQVRKSGAMLVARSVQPWIQYLFYDFFSSLSVLNFPKKIFNLLDICFYIFNLILGWKRSNLILCLGSLELAWMKKNFPFFDKKITIYVNALARNEQDLLSKIRLNRKHEQITLRSVKFLWIGRWASHKGTTNLIDFLIERTRLQPNDSFTLAGCGDSPKDELPKQLIESGQVKILPTFTRENLCDLLENHDVGLFTSKVEGWGLVLNEMLESGMLVYSTYAGGAPDLWDYFQESLRTFPPPLDISFLNLKNKKFDLYYKKFTWESIVDTYLCRVSSNFNSK